MDRFVSRSTDKITQPKKDLEAIRRQQIGYSYGTFTDTKTDIASLDSSLSNAKEQLNEANRFIRKYAYCLEDAGLLKKNFEELIIKISEAYGKIKSSSLDSDDQCLIFKQSCQELLNFRYQLENYMRNQRSSEKTPLLWKPNYGSSQK